MPQIKINLGSKAVFLYMDGDSVFFTKTITDSDNLPRLSAHGISLAQKSKYWACNDKHSLDKNPNFEQNDPPSLILKWIITYNGS